MENNLFAQKRIASMMAQVAISNSKVSNRMFWLTIATIIVGIVQIIVAFRS